MTTLRPLNYADDFIAAGVAERPSGAELPAGVVVNLSDEPFDWFSGGEAKRYS